MNYYDTEGTHLDPLGDIKSIEVSRPFGIYQLPSKAVIIGVGSILIGVARLQMGVFGMIVNNLHVDHCKFLGPELIQSLEVIPDPVSLIESMRAVGYTTETAIADIVDNSISAGAPHILIEYDASRDPFVAILDDGHGMDATELTNAMRHGSSNPNALRAHHDLGRFGLGLKTDLPPVFRLPRSGFHATSFFCC